MTFKENLETTDIFKVLGFAIVSAAALMAVALWVQMVDHTITNVTKDVLPLCTALVGFAGGAVTAVFGRSIAAERLSEKPSTQPNPQPAAPSNTPS